MRKALAILSSLLFASCAHMHIVCQDNGMTSMAIGGNNAGQQILTMGLNTAGGAAKGAALLGSPVDAKPTAPQSQSYVDYTYLPVFGSDFASCNTAPPNAGVSVIVMSPNGGVANQFDSSSKQIVVIPSGSK